MKTVNRILLASSHDLFTSIISVTNVKTKSAHSWSSTSKSPKHQQPFEEKHAEENRLLEESAVCQSEAGNSSQ